jgi:CHAD domain-containing protein
VYVGDVKDLSLELKWLAGVLGDVRDLDVVIAHLRSGAETFSSDDRTAARRLLRALDRDRARARRALAAALEGKRYAALLSRFEEVLRTIEPSHEQRSLASLAHAELKKFDRKSPRTAAGLTDERLHDLRKRSKRVRYAYELAGKGNVAKRAKHLQDVLGDNQDGVVAEQRLRALAETAPPEQALVAGLLIAREQDRRKRARAAWRHAWKRLVDA